MFTSFVLTCPAWFWYHLSALVLIFTTIRFENSQVQCYPPFPKFDYGAKVQPIYPRNLLTNTSCLGLDTADLCPRPKSAAPKKPLPDCQLATFVPFTYKATRPPSALYEPLGLNERQFSYPSFFVYKFNQSCQAPEGFSSGDMNGYEANPNSPERSFKFTAGNALAGSGLQNGILAASNMMGSGFGQGLLSAGDNGGRSEAISVPPALKSFGRGMPETNFLRANSYRPLESGYNFGLKTGVLTEPNVPLSYAAKGQSLSYATKEIPFNRYKNHECLKSKINTLSDKLNTMEANLNVLKSNYPLRFNEIPAPYEKSNYKNRLHENPSAQPLPQYMATNLRVNEPWESKHQSDGAQNVPKNQSAAEKIKMLDKINKWTNEKEPLHNNTKDECEVIRADVKDIKDTKDDQFPPYIPRQTGCEYPLLNPQEEEAQETNQYARNTNGILQNSDSRKETNQYVRNTNGIENSDSRKSYAEKLSPLDRTDGEPLPESVADTNSDVYEPKREGNIKAIKEISMSNSDLYEGKREGNIKNIKEISSERIISMSTIKSQYLNATPDGNIQKPPKLSTLKKKLLSKQDLKKSLMSTQQNRLIKHVKVPSCDLNDPKFHRTDSLAPLNAYEFDRTNYNKPYVMSGEPVEVVSNIGTANAERIGGREEPHVDEFKHTRGNEQMGAAGEGTGFQQTADNNFAAPQTADLNDAITQLTKNKNKTLYKPKKIQSEPKKGDFTGGVITFEEMKKKQQEEEFGNKRNNIQDTAKDVPKEDLDRYYLSVTDSPEPVTQTHTHETLSDKLARLNELINRERENVQRSSRKHDSSKHFDQAGGLYAERLEQSTETNNYDNGDQFVQKKHKTHEPITYEFTGYETTQRAYSPISMDVNINKKSVDAPDRQKVGKQKVPKRKTVQDESEHLDPHQPYQNPTPKHNDLNKRREDPVDRILHDLTKPVVPKMKDLPGAYEFPDTQRETQQYQQPKNVDGNQKTLNRFLHDSGNPAALPKVKGSHEELQELQQDGTVGNGMREDARDMNSDDGQNSETRKPTYSEPQSEGRSADFTYQRNSLLGRNYDRPREHPNHHYTNDGGNANPPNRPYAKEYDRMLAGNYREKYFDKKPPDSRASAGNNQNHAPLGNSQPYPLGINHPQSYVTRKYAEYGDATSARYEPITYTVMCADYAHAQHGEMQSDQTHAGVTHDCPRLRPKAEHDHDHKPNLLTEREEENVATDFHHEESSQNQVEPKSEMPDYTVITRQQLNQRPTVRSNKNGRQDANRKPSKTNPDTDRRKHHRNFKDGQLEEKRQQMKYNDRKQRSRPHLVNTGEMLSNGKQIESNKTNIIAVSSPRLKSTFCKNKNRDIVNRRNINLITENEEVRTHLVELAKMVNEMKAESADDSAVLQKTYNTIKSAIPINELKNVLQKLRENFEIDNTKEDFVRKEDISDYNLRKKLLNKIEKMKKGIELSHVNDVGMTMDLDDKAANLREEKGDATQNREINVTEVSTIENSNITDYVSLNQAVSTLKRVRKSISSKNKPQINDDNDYDEEEEECVTTKKTCKEHSKTLDRAQEYEECVTTKKTCKEHSKIQDRAQKKTEKVLVEEIDDDNNYCVTPIDRKTDQTRSKCNHRYNQEDDRKGHQDRSKCKHNRNEPEGKRLQDDSPKCRHGKNELENTKRHGQIDKTKCKHKVDLHAERNLDKHRVSNDLDKNRRKTDRHEDRTTCQNHRSKTKQGLDHECHTKRVKEYKTSDNENSPNDKQRKTGNSDKCSCPRREIKPCLDTKKRKPDDIETPGKSGKYDKSCCSQKKSEKPTCEKYDKTKVNPEKACCEAACKAKTRKGPQVCNTKCLEKDLSDSYDEIYYDDENDNELEDIARDHLCKIKFCRTMKQNKKYSKSKG
ncbi:hypothetical protein M8J76_008491 [Diaphorina citri]|nr:hypothetical protein M8J76_008491 [Diaphorina citri]